MKPRLYHLGLTVLSIDALRNWLTSHDAIMLDVRAYPNGAHTSSAKRDSFERLLGPHHYRHVPELVNLASIKGEPVRFADEAAGLAIVRAELDTGRPVVLTCGCAAYYNCHRRIIAERLGIVPANLREALEHVRRVAWA